jgi:rubrerythrin
MDLTRYTIKDILLTALKAEIESQHLYESLSQRVSNFLLKDRLNFLRDEEKKHYEFFKNLYYQEVGKEEIRIPEKNLVPLPEMDFLDEKTPVSKLLAEAMQAEKIASDFYREIANRYDSKPTLKNMLLYIAQMELSHYRILEIEKETAEHFEGYNIEYPLMHIGP